AATSSSAPSAAMRSSRAAEGALEEVAAARARAPWSAPGMKALGARALARHLDGEITRAEALAEATLETRRFAKRQRTWFRNQCPDWPRLTLNLDLPVGEAQAEAARAVDAWAAALAAPA
ncbi:MAG: tRNA dimethylallyltransferase, partial [Pseudomonadota bacterium]